MNPDFDARAVRRAIVGDRDDPPLDAATERVLLDAGDPITLHMAATSSRVSADFLQQLWDSANAILEEVASNARCPLEVIEELPISEVHDIVLAFYAHRRGSSHLAFRLIEYPEGYDGTVGRRWRELTGPRPADMEREQPGGFAI